MVSKVQIAAALLLLVGAALVVEAKPPKPAPPQEDKNPEAEYYKLIKFAIPDDVVLECGSMAMLPNNRVAVGTRRGDIYIVDGAFADPPEALKFTKWAGGLHEVLGLAYNSKDGCLYAIQKGEITKLKDTDNRGHASLYETYCDSWGISGDYHEFAFMSPFDKEGNLYVLLTLTGSFTSEAPFRGWCLKITPDGKAHTYASGIRSPGGMTLNPSNDEVWYCDNQGPWNGACALRYIEPGSFQGHPKGNIWYDESSEIGPRPPDPKSGSRIYIEAEKDPKLVPPAILQPYIKLGQSQSGAVFDNSGGAFGPYTNQVFTADQHHSNIARNMLEKVKGRYQGATVLFREGFGSGTVPMIQAPDGSFFVGGTNRGWGSAGPRPFALERLVWTGKTAFEIFDMKLARDGFDLTFTEPIDTSLAGNPQNYDLKTFRYIYQESYGSPEVDPTTCTVKQAIVSPDGKKVHLVVEGLQQGAVHELHVPNLRSAANKPLLHPAIYYTLWNFVE